MTPNQPTWSGGAAPPYAPAEQSGYSGTEGDSTTDVAKQEAANVAQSAAGAAGQVASTAKEQVTGVAAEAKEHASRLTGEARQQVTEQASTQKDRAVSGLRSISQELRGMADKAEESGPATQLARTASSTTEQIAGFLDEREPGQLIDEVRSFARRRPSAFLLGALVAGVIAGRLTRGVVSNKPGDQSSADQDGSGGYGSDPYSVDPYGSDQYGGTGVEPSPYGPGYAAQPSPPPAYGTTAPIPPVTTAPMPPAQPANMPPMPPTPTPGTEFGAGSTGWAEPSDPYRPGQGPGSVNP